LGGGGGGGVVGAGVVVFFGGGVVFLGGAGYIGALCCVWTGEWTLAFFANTIVLCEFLLEELTRL
jgi:hypothetical protein